MDIDTAIANVVKGHSTPTIGRGIPHEGQAGYIVYEGEMPGLVAAIKQVFAPYIEQLEGIHDFAAERDLLKAERGRLAAEVERLSIALGKERTEVERLKDGISSIVCCQSALPRAAVREACAEILNGKTTRMFDQSPFIASLVAARATIAELREALVHIGEYWNGGETDGAMSDALHEIEATAGAALANLDAPPTEVAAPVVQRPVTDDEVRAALGLYRHDADPGASVRSMRAALEQFAKGREG